MSKHAILTKKQQVTMLNLLNMGATQEEIGAVFGVSQATISRYVKQYIATTHHLKEMRPTNE